MADNLLPTQHLEQEMIGWRHDFHQNPELGFNEHRTSARVADLLTKFGLDVHTGVGKTGVVGILDRGKSAISVGIRADMDALPIKEKNTFGYTSKNENVMHACGHDGHTTMLLGAAKALSENQQFKGRAIFVFQPNEEHGLGAPAMIEDGLFDRFGIDEIYGMHNIPEMELGTIATRSGSITASESLFEIEIKAKGGHAAQPHMGVDAIVVGSEIVNALQTIVSRKLNPDLSGVVSVTEFITDGNRNILPSNAVLRGDARALTPEINTIIENRMRQIVNGLCLAHDVSAKITYDTIFPATINTPDQTGAVTKAGLSIAAEHEVDGNCLPKLFSEDFAHMAAAKPGCYVLIGNRKKGEPIRPLHSDTYDFCDDALVFGSSLWVKLVEQRSSAD